MVLTPREVTCLPHICPRQQQQQGRLLRILLVYFCVRARNRNSGRSNQDAFDRENKSGEFDWKQLGPVPSRGLMFAAIN